MNFFVDINNVLNTEDFLQQGSWMVKILTTTIVRFIFLLTSWNPSADLTILFPAVTVPVISESPVVEFQPIVAVNQLTDVNSPHVRPLYYNYADEAYYRWNAETGQFVTADPDFVRQVLDDKAYIDMPNFESFHFFNPRNVIFGVRISF